VYGLAPVQIHPASSIPTEQAVFVKVPVASTGSVNFNL
jgi:hypothetical protein